MLKEEVCKLKIKVIELEQKNSLLEYENNILKNKFTVHEKQFTEKCGYKNILVIDDEDYILALLTEELENIGYKVYSANSGKKGIDIFNKISVDLVVLDINMPEINGLQILRLLKNIPVILYSAYSEHKQAIEAWAADDYIVKSANLSELFDAINKHLTK